MYKAILCDDDEIVIRGLRSCISWEELNIELCGTAFSGSTAMELIDQHRPDIIVSDVRMPFATGIELTKYAKSINEHVQVIIVSGYDSFQYAQQAMRFGAMDYLLKPVDIEELQTLLKKAVQKCSEWDEEKTVKQAYEKSYIKQMVRSLINEGEKGFI